MKPSISKGILFIGLAYAVQANAAVIQITEDRLTTDAAVWFFEEQNPTYPASGNTVVAQDSNRSQSAFLGLNTSTRTAAWAEGNFDFGYAARGAATTIAVTNTSNGFAIEPRPHTYRDDGPNDYGYGAAGWESTSRFIVDGDDASLSIFYVIRGRTDPSDDYIAFELIDETEMITLASLPPESGPGWAQNTFALQDGRSYSLTTSGYLRSPNLSDSDGEPQLYLWFDNATRATVPEPSTALLLMLGVFGMGWIIKRQPRIQIK